ncbi:MAG: lysophospholipid acyltransferase family protein [Thermodesulfobacteriota bacterium]|nr:lysophospholipid acyltransferase family protein [Thermodesulfobacteriota bacterium]
MKVKKIKKKIGKSIKLTFAPLLISLIIRFIFLTLRITEHNPENVRQLWEKDKSVIVVFWHGRLLMVPMLFKRYKERKAYGLTSHHNDGEIIARSTRLLGYETIRGSTGKGGFSALRKMIRILRSGSDLTFAPDGPKGPRYKVQRGVIELARLSGAPIIPMAFSSSKKKILNTWDAFLFPFPFSRGVFVWGDPISIENTNDEEYLKDKRRLVEERLISITNMADSYFKKERDVSAL